MALTEELSDTPGDRIHLLRRALYLSLISIVLSGVLGTIAVVVGLSTGSLSLIGFGFDAAIDGIASIALAWRFATEARHPHRTDNLERTAEIIVGCVLLALAAYLGLNAIQALISNAQPEVTTVGVAISVVSLLALPLLALAKYRTAIALRSGALRADSILTAMAAGLAAISLIGLALTQFFGLTWADAVGALIVTVILLREGWYSVRAAPIH